MKTTRNFNQTAKVTLASVTLLFASLIPMQANSGKNSSSEMNEIQAASNNLAMYNTELEKAVAFNAPSLSENSEAFEVFVAESKLNDMFSISAKETQYTAPAVNEDLDVAVAMENLEALNSQIEESVKYTAE